MAGPAAGPDAHLALLVHVTMTAVAVLAILLVAALLRERRSPGAPDSTYESGATPIGPVYSPQNASYFLIAAFFLIFDMEAGILFAWAVAAREAGLVGLVEAAVFIGVLLAGLAYLILDGAIDFGPAERNEGDPP